MLAVARPYARAAFEYARESGALKEWQENLDVLKEVFGSPLLTAWLSHPQSDQRALAFFLIEAINAPSPLANFLKCLAEASRLPCLKAIADEFGRLVSDQKAIRNATLIVSKSPDKALIAKVKDRLQERFQQEVMLTVTVDPGILGGGVVLSDDFVLDGSVKGQLERLRKQLMN